MYKLFGYLCVLLFSFGMVSCKQVFEYSPNEVRLPVEERELNKKAVARILQQPASDTVRFILIGDTQRFYAETEEFVAHINRLNNINFVVLAGDITDFGLQHEARWVHWKLKQLTVPYIAVIGNHDMLANGRLLFSTMYGPENSAFSWAGNQIILLNTNSNEVGKNGTIPDLGWLEKQLGNQESVNNTVVISHMPPFDAGFDKTKERPYAQLLASQGSNVLSLHGHQHFSSRQKPYKDGVEYIVTASVSKRSYLMVTLFKNGYEVEEHHF